MFWDDVILDPILERSEEKLKGTIENVESRYTLPNLTWNKQYFYAPNITWSQFCYIFINSICRFKKLVTNKGIKQNQQHSHYLEYSICSYEQYFNNNCYVQNHVLYRKSN